MILKMIKLVGRASTVVWVAKTGYDAYQAGSTAYKAYKKVKGAKDGAGNIVSTVTKALKKRPK